MAAGRRVGAPAGAVRSLQRSEHQHAGSGPRGAAGPAEQWHGEGAEIRAENRVRAQTRELHPVHGGAGQRAHQHLLRGVDVPDFRHDCPLDRLVHFGDILYWGDLTSLRGVQAQPRHRLQDPLRDPPADAGIPPHRLPSLKDPGHHVAPGNQQLLHQREADGHAARHRPLPRPGQGGAEHHPGSPGAEDQDRGGRADPAVRLLHALLGRPAGLLHHVRHNAERLHAHTGLRERQVQHRGHPVRQRPGLRGS